LQRQNFIISTSVASATIPPAIALAALAILALVSKASTETTTATPITIIVSGAIVIAATFLIDARTVGGYANAAGAYLKALSSSSNNATR
jgi:Na+-translocating ferredoxin:NAD+ oxidoreductase RnfD subunit